MIVFEQKKIVFVSNPKTGTHTMYKLLQECGGVRHGRYHETEFRFTPSFVFTTIREPLTRTVSVWNSLLFHEQKPRKQLLEKGMVESDTFPAFVDWLCDQDPGRLYGGDWLSGMITNQTRWLAQYEFPINHYINIEKVQEHLQQVPIQQPYKAAQEFKRTNRGFINEQLGSLTGQQLDRLENHLKDDLLLWEKHK